MKLHKIILLLILLSGFSIEIPAQNSLQNEIGKLEYDTLKRDMVKTKHLDHINISDTSSVSCANYLFGNGNGERSGTIGMSIKNNR